MEPSQEIRYVSGDSDNDEELELLPAVNQGVYPFGAGSYSMLYFAVMSE